MIFIEWCYIESVIFQVQILDMAAGTGEHVFTF